MLVVDASAASPWPSFAGGFARLRDRDLVAPGLMWSEARSALHETRWRGEITAEAAEAMRERLESCPVKRRHPADLGRRAWQVADALGWARTYDAEYVALAQMLDCPLLTVDARLARGAARLVRTLGPADL
jgi:predicted nucleic acid-binding protein